MIKVSVRNFTRNAANYMNRVNNGEVFVITKRNLPVADLTPHKGDKNAPKWLTDMPKIKLKENIAASNLYLKYKKEESR